jgi:hypothetical protein
MADKAVYSDEAESFKTYYKAFRKDMILKRDTNEYLDEVRFVVSLAAKLREEFDKLAKAQGNPTIRKVREDAVKPVKELTEAELEAMLEAEIG